MSSPQIELRGGWVSSDSIETEQGRSKLLSDIERANLNTVFVAVPPIEGNYGEGNMESFAEFASAAKQNGQVVLGWMSNHKRTFPDPLDFREEHEREAQVLWAVDILSTFPCLDGIAIDYIRYPEWEISDGEKNEAISDTILRIRQAMDSEGKVLLTTAFAAASVTYRGFNTEWEGDVPEWFQQWYNEVPNNFFQQEAETGGTGIVNQANLGGPNPEYLLGPSFMGFQQDPITWIQRQLVDYITPMQYTADPIVMQNEVDVWAAWCSHFGHPISTINMGLGWLDEPSSFLDSAFDPSAMVAHINYARSKGIGGFTLFRLGIPGIDDEPLIQALTTPNSDNNWTPPFAVKVESPLAVDIAVQRSSFGSPDNMCLNAMRTASGSRSVSVVPSMTLAMLVLTLLRFS
jgi:hypothetical protein